VSHNNSSNKNQSTLKLNKMTFDSFWAVLQSIIKKIYWSWCYSP